LLLAGKGHNGDDARAALPHLEAREVDCLNVLDPVQDLAALRTSLNRQPALVVDALFGIGLSRPLDRNWQKFIATLNAAGRTVIAVDVPSGLNADTGEPMGAAVVATATLAVGAPKTGLLAARAWPFVGRLQIAANIGLVDSPPGEHEVAWVEPHDFRHFPPPRPVTAHKGDFGHLDIVAGSPGYHGASVLCARAAQRAQVGLVTLHTLPEVFVPVAAQLQGAMVRPWSAGTSSLSERYTALLLGPGLAAQAATDAFAPVVRELWCSSPVPVIVDASALDWLPDGAVPKGAIRVITPHPGEAARLLKSSPAAVQADRPGALREISRRLGDCWVVLKGHQTLVGRSTGALSVNSSGNPHLAQGGSGDALAGYLAGLLAQPALQADCFQTLRYAVWQHGAAADALSSQRPNWVVEELAATVGMVPAD
jgi:NAD(P)H-hydrate epimerase